jgi:uncharacterized repeat protein (TIGR03803 family)
MSSLRPIVPALSCSNSGRWHARQGVRSAALSAIALVIFASAAYGQPAYEIVARSGTGQAYSSVGLIQANDGGFYGIFSYGSGTPGVGTIFMINASGQLTPVCDFTDAVGAGPTSALLQGSDGAFYGTALGGADPDDTILFRIDAGCTLTTLAVNSNRFLRANGSLIQASDGNFYYTAWSVSDPGAIVKVDPLATPALTLLYEFSGIEGFGPNALIQANDGAFYGTTQSSSNGFGGGILFRIDAAGTLTTLYTFTGGDDGASSNGLVEATDGTFYGTTGQFSPLSTGGTIFRYDGPGILTTLHTFTGGDGVHPRGLIQASDGSFYGTTRLGGASGVGTIFKFDKAGTLTTLHSFDGSDGGYPLGGLLQASDGTLYGSTETGVVFRFTLATPTTISLTASPEGSKFGQQVTLVARVESDTNTPTGTVQFFDGGTLMATVTAVDGTATLKTRTLAVGSHVLSATYLSDGTLAPSTSSSALAVVNKASTKTALVGAPNPSGIGQTVTLTATVRASGPGAGIPTGNVEFFAGAISLGSAALTNTDGQMRAMLVISTLMNGTNVLTAGYMGDPNFNVSASPAWVEIVK